VLAHYTATEVTYCVLHFVKKTATGTHFCYSTAAAAAVAAKRL
jgi:hypothetical protein